MKRIRAYLEAPVGIEALALYRIILGALLAVSALRFIHMGWVDALYLDAVFQFKYYGFDWVEPLGRSGMYAVEWSKAALGLMIMIGLFYRPAIIGYFLLFSYTELIDKTYYLNHYYFVSLICFLLIWMPANRKWSLDNRIFRRAALSHVPRWTVGSLRLQIAIVYLFAGFAKLQSDWLLDAMPLRLWLPAKDYLPLIGPLLSLKATAYFFSWFGALYDICIPLLLWWNRSRPLAFVAVIAFHAMTALLFPIGMFPWIMMLGSLIFLETDDFQRIKRKINPIFGSLFGLNPNKDDEGHLPGPNRTAPILMGLLAVHFLIQLLLPLRSRLYPGNLFWTEQGYRFSWRVMLVEKAGSAQFKVQDGADDIARIVDNRDFLNRTQEKQMAFQPDMILAYAHFLSDHFRASGMKDPIVTADVFVSLNGRPSQRLVDSSLNLAVLPIDLKNRNWILPAP